jgi:hypothetical protein
MLDLIHVINKYLIFDLMQGQQEVNEHTWQEKSKHTWDNVQEI